MAWQKRGSRETKASPVPRRDPTKTYCSVKFMVSITPEDMQLVAELQARFGLARKAALFRKLVRDRAREEGIAEHAVG